MPLALLLTKVEQGRPHPPHRRPRARLVDAVVVAVQIWFWMTNHGERVLNYVLTELHFGNYFEHDWYAVDVLAAQPR